MPASGLKIHNLSIVNLGQLSLTCSVQFQGESIDAQNHEAPHQFPGYVIFETEAFKGVPISETLTEGNSERFQMILVPWVDTAVTKKGTYPY